MKNKNLKPIMISFIISILIFGFFPSTVFGESGQVLISVQPTTIDEGEVFTINVTFTNDGEGISSLDANLSYDKNLMEYTTGGSNTVQVSEGKGVIIDSGSSSNTLSYSFQFLAKKPGKARFSVDHSELIGSDKGKLLGNPKASIDLTIQASSGQSQEEEEDDTEEFPDRKDDPIEVDRDGSLIYILRDYPSSEIPEGFEPFSLIFKGEEVMGAKNPTTEMILLYGIDQNLDYSFYIYDYTENLVPYVTLTISGDQEYTFLPMDITPEGYQVEEILINGKSVSLAKPEDFKGIYLAKAMNSDGEEGYYFYDEREGTLQRAVVHDNVVEPEEDASSMNWIIILLGSMVIILMILVIKFSSSLKKNKNHTDK